MCPSLYYWIIEVVLEMCFNVSFVAICCGWFLCGVYLLWLGFLVGKLLFGWIKIATIFTQDDFGEHFAGHFVFL